MYFTLECYFRLPDQIQTCTTQDAYRSQRKGGFIILQHQPPPHHQHQCDGLLLHHGGLHLLSLQQQGKEDNIVKYFKAAF